jgi:hypothetical protein
MMANTPSTAKHKGLNDVKLTHDHPRFDCISNENIKTAIDLADDYFVSNGAEEYNRKTQPSVFGGCAAAIPEAG